MASEAVEEAFPWKEEYRTVLVPDSVLGLYPGTERPNLWADMSSEERLHELHVMGFVALGRTTETFTPAVAATTLAAERLLQICTPTPLEYAPHISTELEVPIFLKREDQQDVHSFKIRGAFNKMAQLSESERLKGVLAASAGNHAQGVALSAQVLGISATIVMPRTTPSIKIAAVESLGATVVLEGDSYNDAYKHSQILNETLHAVFVHPFNDPDVIAGQGTAGKEIIEQQPETTHIFVPIGGGGLISGIAQYVKALRPDIKIIGVQPEDSNAMQQSVKAGKQVALTHVGIFADGVAVKEVGDLTYALTMQYVDDIITVTNDQIAAATEDFYIEARSIVEPAGALSLAAVRKWAVTVGFEGTDMVATVASGANMSFSSLRYIAELNEIGRNREALFGIILPEKPGSLLRLCEEVVNGHNITEFRYRLQDRQKANIFVGFAVSGTEDKEGFMKKMRDYDYNFVDLSSDNYAKEHVRHMVGGTSPESITERLYEIQFPERPGALLDFLKTIDNKWNISLFHYRSLGGDTGKVLIGFEQPDVAQLESLLHSAKYDFDAVSSPATKLFLT